VEDVGNAELLCSRVLNAGLGKSRQETDYCATLVTKFHYIVNIVNTKEIHVCNLFMHLILFDNNLAIFYFAFSAQYVKCKKKCKIAGMWILMLK